MLKTHLPSGCPLPSAPRPTTTTDNEKNTEYETHSPLSALRSPLFGVFRFRYPFFILRSVSPRFGVYRRRFQLSQRFPVKVN